MLETIGWNSRLENLKNEVILSETIPGRVSIQSRDLFTVMTSKGEWLCTLPGSYNYEATFDYPAVGDWVMVSQLPGEERGIIRHVFERTSVFARNIAGNETKAQMIATNIDYAFLVMSCNDDFNVRRLERYLVAAWDSGSTPIILLTKADLANETMRSHLLLDVESVAYGVPVHFVSSENGENVEIIKEYLHQHLTGVLLGSSGVGKSTLVNQLLHQEIMDTKDIRSDDSKGRHTTTHRELLVLPSGGVIIDTPGMRELQLWSSSDQTGLSESFSDIEELATQCKFKDCGHNSEPGCAINQAIGEGILSRKRYDSYLKLQRELAFTARKERQGLKRQEKLKKKESGSYRKRNPKATEKETLKSDNRK
ncbi:ribosome small subunit-dependent GTPase A [Desemzia sp. RIT804]|uniref:ribosome small subunit-dependent GTPase A n=1 Tax=Desemzia sp. RIT 804 TaxID=2810209 RepID=UPI0019507439|nr:ribosome small subunit-dependent GTPase A [Desemzia sp. RIT 804]MBM6614678.1 ribosome small subunit-dependent GTPase A [Desemzia sp. RIT 804]